MHFRRVERELANRAPCFLWFFGFIVWDQGQQGVPIAGLEQILPGLTSAILHCWCPGRETNSIHLHGLVSFLLHSLLTFPSLHLHIITINNKHTSRNPSESPPTVAVNSSAKLNINFAFALLCSHPSAYLLSPVLVQVPMAVSPQDCAHAPGSGT